MPTSRRRFLAAVAAAGAGSLAGCTGGDGVDREPYAVEEPVDPAAAGDGNGIDSPATSLVEDVQVLDLEVADLTVALAPTRFRATGERSRGDSATGVRFAFGRTASADGPATVRARITNGVDRERTVALEERPPFVANATEARTRPNSDDDGERTGVVDATPDPAGELVLAPIDDATRVDFSAESSAYERGPDGHWRLVDDVEWTLPDAVALDANESVELTFALVGPPGSEGRPPGTYAVGGSDRVTAVAWPTAEPGTDPDSRFGGADLPALPDDGDGTAWYHAVDRSTPVYVEPAAERAAAPADLEFELVNRSREVRSATGWHLYKLADGAWHPVAPATTFGPVVTAPQWIGTLHPGRVRRWRLRALPGESTGDGDRIDVPHLGGGRYAFAVRNGGGAVAAAFDLEAPALSIEPTDGLERRREDGAVRLRSPEREEASEPWELTLEPADEAGDARRLLPEAVYRESRRGVRNVLAVAVETGADRVVLETSRAVALRAVGGATFRGNGPRSRVRFRGRTYELEAGPPEDADEDDPDPVPGDADDGRRAE